MRTRAPESHNHIPEAAHVNTFAPESLQLPRTELLLESGPGSIPVDKLNLKSMDWQLHILSVNSYKKIWKADSVEQFMDVFVDCVKCHHAAYVEGKVLHRDLCENNLMFKEATDGKKGILNDWDMASWLDAKNESKLSTAGHRTGTFPFMSIDLLVDSPPPHLYRHDLESFFYILVWAALHYTFSNGERKQNDPFLLRWDAPIVKDARSNKCNFFNEPDECNKIIAQVQPNCQPLVGWITELWDLFSDALRAYNDHQRAVIRGSTEEWNMETQGGRLTFESFMAALGRTPRPLK